jgi:hypothetical protein
LSGVPELDPESPWHALDGPDPDGFMPRDEIVRYVERYREFVDPPMRSPVAVKHVHRIEDGWRLVSSVGDWDASQLIVAGGSFQTGRKPPSSEALSADTHQIHTDEYRNPQDLPRGAVLVVGSGQSGCQITDDLREAGRDVWLSVGSATRVPRRYWGRDTFTGSVISVFWTCPCHNILVDRTHGMQPIRRRPEEMVVERSTCANLGVAGCISSVGSTVVPARPCDSPPTHPGDSTLLTRRATN